MWIIHHRVIIPHVIAHTTFVGHHLRSNDQNPRNSHGEFHPGEDLRHGSRQDHLPQHLFFPHPEGHGSTGQTDIHLGNPTHGVIDNREEGPVKGQKDSLGLEINEEQHRQWNPGDRGDRAHHLKDWKDQMV